MPAALRDAATLARALFAASADDGAALQVAHLYCSVAGAFSSASDAAVRAVLASLFLHGQQLLHSHWKARDDMRVSILRPIT